MVINFSCGIKQTNKFMKEEIKYKIQGYIDQNYGGSLRFIRTSTLVKFLTYADISEIKKTTALELHVPTSQMIFCYLNDITEPPTCPCGKLTKFDQVRKRFRPYCGVECQRSLYKGTVDKRKATCMDRYGATSYIYSEEGKAKTKEVCLEKYGNEFFSKTDQFKELRKTW